MARYSWEAEQRRREREEQRRLRELERQAKERAKLSAIEAARLEVEQHDAQVQVLLSVHRECSRPFDWIGAVSALVAPVVSTHENEFHTRLSQIAARPPEPLSSLAEQAAKTLDAQAFQKASEQNAYDCKERDRFAALGARILSGEPAAYDEAIKEQGCFYELVQLGCTVTHTARSSNLIECEIQVPGTHVIPTDTKTLTSTNKLSVKSMSKGRFHEIYEDFVCGAVLRVAREAFSLLPVESVVAHGLADCADPSTGIERVQCVISVAFDRARFLQLDFGRVDASDTVALFPNNCDFRATRKTGAFKPVVRLSSAIALPQTPTGASTQALLKHASQLTAELRDLCDELDPGSEASSDKNTSAITPAQ